MFVLNKQNIIITLYYNKMYQILFFLNFLDSKITKIIQSD